MNQFESAEDYLERILMLSKEKSLVRAIDIANDMNFSKPSVSIALKKLKTKELIVIDEKTGGISLTSSGLQIASNVLNRHEVLTKALMMLGVSEEVAKEDACKIEHDLSEETFLKIENHVKKQVL